jgi:hypothetical protein
MTDATNRTDALQGYWLRGVFYETLPPELHHPVTTLERHQATEIATLRAQVSAMRAYARHLPLCDSVVNMVCTCGFTALLTEPQL